MTDYPSMVFEFPDFDAVVPLICRQCGNCCRKYYVQVDVESLPEIAQTMKKPIYHIQENLNLNLELYIEGKPADCLFLSGCKCLIHYIKPEPCRQFPSFTDSGMVDCPSHKEFKRIERQLSSPNGGVVNIRRPSSLREPRKIPDRKLGKLLKALENAGASEVLVREFMILNRATP